MRRKMGGLESNSTKAFAWLKRNFTFLGVFWFLVFLGTVIPDAFGREEFWRRYLPMVWKFFLKHPTPIIVIICAVFIWLDHTRVIEKGRQKYDRGTLKGRTEELRDEIAAWLAALGEKPPLVYNSSMEAKEFSDSNKGYDAWCGKLQYGFILRFQERLQRLYYEYGEQGQTHLPLAFALEPGQVGDAKAVNGVIEMLGKMADSL